MDTQSIIQRLKEIRSGSHCKPQTWLENEISRLIAKLESHEVDREMNQLMMGNTLVSGGLEIKLIMER